VPSIGGEHVGNDGQPRLGTLRFIPRSYYESLTQGRICRGDILVVKDGATTGKTAFVGADFPIDEAAVNEHVFIVRVDPGVLHPRFAFYWLFSSEGKKQVLSDFRGSAQGGITRNFVQLVKLPLPPLSEQRRIVEILDQADTLRRKRAEADTKAARILPALFYQMFGDPVTNPMGWEQSNLGQLLAGIDSGWSPNCLDRASHSDEWGVLKLGAVTTCSYLEQENKALPDHCDPRSNLEVKPGDLLFSRKNTYQLVGACAFVNTTRPKLMISDLIFRLRLKNSGHVIPEYLWGLLTEPSKRRQIQSLASGSAGSMPNVSKSRLRTLPIESPPLSLQRQFAYKMTMVRQSQIKQDSSGECLDDLFQSLLHRAFSGDLTARWRETHMVELLAEMEHQARALGATVGREQLPLRLG
jgi:type I restriction enzyme S subunit